ncbi:MAG: DUF2059 domain-containing protein [Bryobacteraceae bacterium]
MILHRALIAFIALVSPAAIAHAQDAQAAKLANIEEMLRLTKADQSQRQVWSQIKAMTAAQMEKAGVPRENQAEQSRTFDMLADRMSWERIKPAYIKLWDETFTAGEIAGIVDFYKTPAGQAMVEKMPIVTSKMMNLAQQIVQDLLPEIMRKAGENAAGRGQDSPGGKTKP